MCYKSNSFTSYFVNHLSRVYLYCILAVSQPELESKSQLPILEFSISHCILLTQWILHSKNFIKIKCLPRVHCWKWTIRFQVKAPKLFLWILFICRLLSYILNFQKMPPRKFWANQFLRNCRNQVHLQRSQINKQTQNNLD